MSKCEYYADRECIESDACDSMFVSCDECEYIDSEGYCDNKNGSHFPDFVDGLTVCCRQFKKIRRIIEIKYDGSEKSILKLMEHLPGDCKCIRAEGKHVIIPTLDGARQVYRGDTVVIDGLCISIKD